MGKVATIFKIMPVSVKTDLVKLKDEIKNKLNPQDIKEEPIAFGLKAIKVMVITDDASGGTEEIEKSLKSIKGVKEIQVEDVTLL